MSNGRVDQSMTSIASPPPSDSDDEIVTLVLVVCLFIFCNSLGLAISFVESSEIAFFQPYMNYLVDISNLLVALTCFEFCVHSDRKSRQLLLSSIELEARSLSSLTLQ